MRLWTIHPKHLDAKGLVALWREGLLAKCVLEGKTKGYKHHPQLIRFKQHENPKAAINLFLHSIVDEAEKRAYAFDRSKLTQRKQVQRIPTTTGQFEYERKHLLKKLKHRDIQSFEAIQSTQVEVHPIFVLIEGEVEDWEVTSARLLRK